jgi:tetratricopeptide (TPR) repeat protein
MHKKLTNQIAKLLKNKDFCRAEQLLKKQVKSSEKDLEARLHLAEIQVITEDYRSASFHFSEVIKYDPKNVAALAGLGACLIRLGDFESAGTILEYAISLKPRDLAVRINYASILQARSLHEEALKNAADVVAIDPLNPIAYNNLGSALLSLDFYREARTAFETAIALDPNYSDAAANIAGVAVRMGDFVSAAENYERALAKLPANAQHHIGFFRFGLSAALLALGRLEEGWKNYEFGFLRTAAESIRRNPLRVFDKPRWTGESLSGKRLLVWREQGLGDELLFFTCLKDLLKFDGEVIVECDPRLVIPIQRSFPRYVVRQEFIDLSTMNSPYSDFDLQIPAGALPAIFRKSLQDFPNRSEFIFPSGKDVEDFENRLAPYQNKKLVGICWRSGLLNAARNRYYTHLSDWLSAIEILKDDVTFVNLQYGECENEISNFEVLSGTKVLRWSDLDLKNDLDRVMALISCLDAVVTVGTAVVSLAGAVGCRSILIEPYGAFDLGAPAGTYPWFPNTRKLCPSPEETAASQLGKIPLALRSLLSGDVPT